MLAIEKFGVDTSLVIIEPVSSRDFHRILRSGAAVLSNESGQYPNTAEFDQLIGGLNLF